MLDQRWFQYAVLSAVTAAAVGILSKVGLRHIDPTLATAVRSIFMAAILIAVCIATGVAKNIGQVDARSMLTIVLAAIAGAASWLFYFKALQLGSVSQVAPVDKLSVPIGVLLAVLVLGERPTAINWAGIALTVVGVYLAAMPASK